MVQRDDRKGRHFQGPLVALLFCLTGILINIVGAQLALTLKLPLFLDCIGTLFASALGGFVPGIFVGFITNVINGLSDYVTTYYAVVSVLIAICAAAMADRDGFRRPVRILLTVELLALTGGGLGSILTWFLFGGGIGEGISAPLATRLLNSGFAGEFLSQLTADLVIDLADKAVVVLIVALGLRLIPEEMRLEARHYFRGWRQTPMSEKDYSRAKHGAARGMPLQIKITLVLGVAVLVIAVVVTGISFLQFHEANVEQQSRMGMGVARVAAAELDPNRVDEYIEKGEEAEGYLQIKSELSHLMQSSEDIEFVYIYRILPDGCHVVFDPDTEDVPGEAPGTVIPFDEAFQAYLPKLLAGEPIDPVVSNETYGWLLTVYLPVYDDQGVCQCYAAADISMTELVKKEYIFLTHVVALFLGFFIMILAVVVWLAKYHIILPINSMALTFGRFDYDSEEARADSIRRIRGLGIHTGDEIESLYQATVRTTEDTARYIAENQEKNETINKLQNGLIMVLADLVESRDKCTGDHVRKTAAYTRIILEQMRREGIYKEALTDDFINDVISSAPLHDVGKIKVSDTILNKPGRLTDAEFALMRQHSAAGGDILEHAIDAISAANTGYLKEARNLANYHHEKWDGSGYPNGLKGEEIPLSARIMAVADVFDALVSTRSYKKGFPIEKALDIIREGSGSHFDPNVAKAFLDAEEEVRRVAKAHAENLFA